LIYTFKYTYYLTAFPQKHLSINFPLICLKIKNLPLKNLEYFLSFVIKKCFHNYISVVELNYNTCLQPITSGIFP